MCVYSFYCYYNHFGINSKVKDVIHNGFISTASVETCSSTDLQKEIYDSSWLTVHTIHIVLCSICISTYKTYYCRFLF